MNVVSRGQRETQSESHDRSVTKRTPLLLMQLAEKIFKRTQERVQISKGWEKS